MRSTNKAIAICSGLDLSKSGQYLGIVTELFRVNFPFAERIRNSVAHQAEILSKPEKHGQSGELSIPFMEINLENDYFFSYNLVNRSYYVARRLIVMISMKAHSLNFVVSLTRFVTPS
jgi:hypothetical protein